MEAPKQILAAVRFSYGPHGAENIPALERVETDANNFFGLDPNVRFIYFDEAFGRTHQRLEEFKRLYRTRGSFFDTRIIQGGRQVQDIALEHEFLSKFRQAAKIKGWRHTATMIASDTHSVISGLFTSAEFLMLDKLATQRTIELGGESYSDSEARRLRSFASAHGASIKGSMDALNEGKVDTAIRITRNGEEALAQEARLRHQRVRQKTTKFVDQASTDDRPIKIFARFGAYHDSLTQQISNDHPGIPVTSMYDYKELALASPSRLLAMEYYEGKTNVEDEIVLKTILEHLVGLQLIWSDKSEAEITLISARIAQITSGSQIASLIRKFPSQGIQQTMGQFIYSALY